MKAILQNRKVLPFYWLMLALITLIADYRTGPFIQFPILYLIPIALSSWYNRCWWSIALALTMPLCRAYFVVLWEEPWTLLDAGLNTVIRIAVLSAFAVLVDQVAQRTKRLTKEVRALEGLLPICCFCKKICDEDEAWQPIETYISTRSSAQFSHGLCPDCCKEHYAFILEDTSQDADAPIMEKQ